MCLAVPNRFDEDSINMIFDYNAYFRYHASNPFLDFANRASVASTSQVRVSHFVIADYMKLASTRLEWPPVG
jgi:hypothetical protein